ncbi:MAG: hypothetical protein M1812_004962 [Candelaria pacifica]|nr:MAG: hypothetical protein M1812_004962 [Candelaria pacifica]
MAEWRDRGYVPDSDEEEELEDSRLQLQAEEEPTGRDSIFRNIDDIQGDGSDSSTPQVEGGPQKVSYGDRKLIGAPSNIQENRRRGGKDIEEVLLLEPALEPNDNHISARSSPTRNCLLDVQAEAQLDTESHHETTVPGGEVLPLEDDLESTSSLSLLSSSPAARLSPTPAANPSNGDGVLSVDISAPGHSALLGVVITNSVVDCDTEEKFGEDVGVASWSWPVRSLRQRKAIQLHPYALEGERYRQSLQARGLKPLRIAQAEAEAAVIATAESEEQEIDHDKDSQSQAQTSQPSSPVRYQSVASISDDELASNLLYEGGENDFPDVDALLHRWPSEGVQRGHKRQKTSHTRTYPGRQAIQVGDESRDQRTDQHTSPPMISSQGGDKDSATAVFDVPPSPPSSGRSSRPRARQARSPVFRYPRGRPSRKPDTPILTSDPLHSELTSTDRISIDSELDNNCSGGSDVISREPSRSPSERTDFGDVSQMRKVQRKIRGVLPASWLRLDQQTKPSHERRVVPKSTTTSPNKVEIGRGVARRISSSKSKVRGILADSEGPIEVSDASETSGDDLAVPDEDLPMSPSDRMLQRGQQGRSTEGTSDIWEDDRIDAMLPSASRHRTHVGEWSRNVKKGQVKKPHYTLFRKSHSWIPHQPRITDHLESVELPKSSKAKPKASGIPVPKLSVIDAPDSCRGLQKTVPRFIKIATRQVRRRRDKGRHSPSRKFIKLHHRLDTNDIENVLRDWREGSIAPIRDDPIPAQNPKTQRAPLAERILNEQPNPKLGLAQRKRPPFPSHSMKLNEFTKSRSSKLVKVNPRQSTFQVAIQRSHTRAPTQHSTEPLDHTQPLLLQSTHKRIWSANNPRLRPAQVESLEADFNHRYAGDAFQKGLSKIDLLFRDNLNRAPLTANGQLAKFLSNGSEAAVSRETLSDSFSEDHREPGTILKQSLTHKSPGKGRKRYPQRIDADILDYRQPAEPILVASVNDTPHLAELNVSSILRGLGTFGTRYTVDFDITQLQPGTFFHETTFVGSGDFAKSMATTIIEQVDSGVGQIGVLFQGKALRWGVWNDRVSSELGIVLDWIGHQTEESSSHEQTELKSQTTSLFRSLIRYFATNLHFSGSYERTCCVLRCLELLRSLLDRLHRPDRELMGAGRQNQSTIALRTATFCSVWANQLRRIAVEDVASRVHEAKIQELLETALEWVVRTLPTETMAHLRVFLEDNKYHAKREAGIRDDHIELESVVIAMQLMQQANISKSKLLSMARRRVDNVEKLTDARDLEGLWYDTITLLPLQEFDEFGVLAPGSRFRRPFEDWSVIQDIVTRIFTIYSTNSRRQLPSFNDYCRNMLTRCHHLITYWGWRKCETIIGTLFDFFARNNLAHLRNEESHGSPQFLEDLDKVDSLEIGPEDRCFHIFLKIIGTGFKAMRQVYTEKRIRDIAWRMMPNHGRSYPKEESVRREDLGSLRNHHDLLCTLYWASPPSSRPRASVIKNLVYAETAHREACHINIRAWYNLVKFQLSTQEPASSLQPFADWHGELTRQILVQHNLARTEANSHFAAFMGSKGTTIPLELLETTISTNQRQVEGILSDLLISMRKAMAMTKSHVNAKALIESSSIADVLDLFDPQTPRINIVIEHALQLVLEFVRVCKGEDFASHPQRAGEDSQDYGPWLSDEDIAVVESSAESGKAPALISAPLNDSSSEAVKYLHSKTFGVLARLVSNAFGSDMLPSDDILLLITDTWCTVAHILVKHNIKHWSNYLASYNRQSWNSLRSTQQTRRYTAYFLSKVIEMDRLSYEDHHSTFITSWVQLLVSPDFEHGFNHELTNSLLNIDRTNPLFANLPFSVNPSSGKYCINRDEFSQGKLSLISREGILANMREGLRQTIRTSLAEEKKLRQDYNLLLKKLMSAMKESFQAMQPKTSQHGHYIVFAQAVVAFLQEYTLDICPVDKFFTDSEEFPLPENDPTYVVSRLRNYGRRLNDPGIPKQLAVYIRTRSESAAQNDQQLQLSEHLRQAMFGTYETGDPMNPTLRWILAMFIFPAYLRIALTPNHNTGWVLAKPILDATRGMFEDIMLDFDPNDQLSMCSVTDMITAIFDSLYQTMNPVLNSEMRVGLLDDPIVVLTSKTIFLTIASALPVLDFIKRRGGLIQPALRFLESFKITGIFWLTLGRDGHIYEASLPCDALKCSPHQFVGLQPFCAQELLQTMKKGWIQPETYWLTHEGLTTRYFDVPSCLVEEGGYSHEWGFKDFFDVLFSMSSLYPRRLSRQRRRDGVGMANVIL